MNSTSTMMVSNRSSNLLILLNTLPFSNFWRFLLYLDGATVMQLSSTISRPLLAGPHAVRELDFLYWCARDHYHGEHMPTDPAVLLQALDWYDTYRRRVCTERNWRHNDSTSTILPLPKAFDASGWIISYKSATAILLNSNKASCSSTQHVVGLECTANTSHLHPLNACCTASTTPPPADRFVVTVSSCSAERRARLEIRDRKTFQLKHTGQLPYKSMLRSINGQWALLSCTEMQADGTEARQLIVLDLERQVRHTKRVRTEWASMCIQQANSKMAVIYATRLDTVNYEGIDWATYKFSSKGSIKRLRRGYLKVDGDMIEYLCAHPLDATSVLLETKGYEDNRQLIIHTVTDVEEADFELDMIEVPEKQVAATLLNHGIGYQSGDQLFIQRQDKPLPLSNNRHAYWPDAIKMQHVIGDLCIMHEWQNNGGIRVVLVDTKSGQIIRPLTSYNPSNSCSFLMTSMMTIDNKTNKAEIIDYGAL
ncbi:hypothetical protein BDF19DRAFT_444921 [Syncephalis fuscata]|nr:hypothetical protein BDF19DRAFT_444921 [Syncephalis fuscata]